MNLSFFPLVLGGMVTTFVKASRHAGSVSGVNIGD